VSLGILPIGVAGLTLRVRGLDAVDGTPVPDVKPQMTGLDPRGKVRKIMAGYRQRPGP
jgi:tRNA (Thr-GGU) A37 N-methylase